MLICDTTALTTQKMNMACCLVTLRARRAQLLSIGLCADKKEDASQSLALLLEGLRGLSYSEIGSDADDCLTQVQADTIAKAADEIIMKHCTNCS